MRFLFVHQNFPGQFRHVAHRLADDPNNMVVAVGDARNLRGRPRLHPKIQLLEYSPHRSAHASTHHYLRDAESHICRGQSVAKLLLSLREKSFEPDVIVAHPGWGEALFLRDIFPKARHIYYLEYYYHSHGGDVGFDPEFPSDLDGSLRVRIKNHSQLHALVSCDIGLSPTNWQRSRYPAEFSEKIRVIHDGIDTKKVAPDKNAWIEINGKRFEHGDPLITYVSRNLEPYRGFHSLIRALPKIQSRCPQATVVIVGGDDVSYGGRLPDGQTYRDFYTAMVANTVDWSKVVFIPRLAYADYVRLLQVSAAHVYLTYPFVLSWSLLEAMSAGCMIVASRTSPVEEVIHDGVTGRLFDFFDHEEMASVIEEVMSNPSLAHQMRMNAREKVCSDYDLETLCLPQQLQLLKTSQTAVK